MSVNDSGKGIPKTMIPTRKGLVAALAATAAVAGGAPVAHASTVPTATHPPLTGASQFQAAQPIPGPIGPIGGAGLLPVGGLEGAGSGDTGATENNVAMGVGGLSFIGPSVGQIASVIGPTIIGPSVVGGVVVSAGNGVVR
jgi:hypothetical protein